MEPGATVFDCLTISGERLRFLVARDSVTIREPHGDSLQIRGEQLTRIEYRNLPWTLQNRGPQFALSFAYRNGTEEATRDVYLPSCDQASVDLLLALKNRHPDKSFIGPNEAERERVLAASYRAVYRLHSLAISTFLGVSTGILVIAILMLKLPLVTTVPASIGNGPRFHTAAMVLMVLALCLFSLLIAILGKRLMVLRSDPRGLTSKAILQRRTIRWQDLEVGRAAAEESTIYTGLFCYYCDRPEVVASKAYVEIPLQDGAARTTTVKLPVDEASRFYRELYYRGKVSLEAAEGVMAFR
ncbi:MAG TPA: hypothetical protein VEI04_03960 [Syntrophobacteria bacterium]|nr:hypothetical protein [Syntrophobacteria bacterium]